jgi:hypothetical protein
MMKYILIASILALELLAGCTDTEIISTPLKGSIKGIVQCYGRTSEDNSGVLITVEGSEPEIQVMSDVKGDYEINDLPTGTYDLVFSKPGYGTHKIIGYSFVGGDEPVMLSSYIYQLLDLTIKELTVTLEKYDWSQSAQLYAQLHFEANDEPSTSGMLRYYISTSPDVSLSNYQETNTTYFFASGGEYSFQKQINTTRYTSGTDLYIVVYPCLDTYLNYIDVNTGNLIYSSVNPNGSPVAHVKIP